ncbi:hypothetical protein GE061_009286 [Apolygus lucorum]|uniref:Uncharacterized protein n=1 Tax=Apolygus lucorum TaxID=248454 RepID=A0A6A4JTS5_APOLU|nr:hypothetical protein GE061_009286 [Apolygus lucorum]
MNILLFVCVIALSSVVSGVVGDWPPKDKMCTPGFMEWDVEDMRCSCVKDAKSETPDKYLTACVGTPLYFDENGYQHVG